MSARVRVKGPTMLLRLGVPGRFGKIAAGNRPVAYGEDAGATR